MRAIEAGLRILVNHGIKHVFGVPAGSINPLYDALIDLPDIHPVITKHETGAGYMATAYSRITGTPSLVVGSSGPGATNLITPAANAFREKVPVIFFTGSVPTHVRGKGGAQELLAPPLFQSVTKMSKAVMNPEDVPTAFIEALTIAQSGVPGPVHLEIPINVQMQEISAREAAPIQLTPIPFQLSKIRELATFIVNPKHRGAILAGYGAKIARNELLTFAESLGWPVATSPRGKGAFPENHPLSLGVYGLAGHDLAIDYLNSNDFEILLVIGSSLGELATNNWDPKLLEGKKLLQIDIDADTIGKIYEPELFVIGDAQIVLQQINLMINSIPRKSATLGFNQSTRAENEDNFTTQSAIRTIGHLAPNNTRIYVDIGEFMTYSIHELQIRPDMDFDIDINFGGMGSGIGGAIGAKLAEPWRPVYCITGDGCYFMHGSEMLTAKEFHIPVVFFVINNRRLGMVHHGHLLQYQRALPEFSQTRVSIANAARELGITTYSVDDLESLRALLNHQIPNVDAPIMVEVVVNGEEIPPMGGRVKFLEGATF